MIWLSVLLSSLPHSFSPSTTLPSSLYTFLDFPSSHPPSLPPSCYPFLYLVLSSPLPPIPSLPLSLTFSLHALPFTSSPTFPSSHPLPLPNRQSSWAQPGQELRPVGLLNQPYYLWSTIYNLPSPVNWSCHLKTSEKCHPPTVITPGRNYSYHYIQWILLTSTCDYLVTLNTCTCIYLYL